MGTGVAIQVCSPESRSPVVASPSNALARATGSISVCPCSRYGLALHGAGHGGGIATGSGRVVSVTNPEALGRGATSPLLAEEGINAVKRLAVSTGPLRRLPAVHFRPIDLVVFQEPSHLRAGDLFLEGVSRLYAFSVYPGRT